MRTLVRRVLSASVSVKSKTIGEIRQGLVLYIAVDKNDAENDIEWVCKKVLGLRIFEDSEKRMNLSVQNLNYDILIISQFTLFGSIKKGFRPSFTKAAHPANALKKYEDFVRKVRNSNNGSVYSGKFGEDMRIEAIDDGPVSIWLDSKLRDY